MYTDLCQSFLLRRCRKTFSYRLQELLHLSTLSLEASKVVQANKHLANHVCSVLDAANWRMAVLKLWRGSNCCKCAIQIILWAYENYRIHNGEKTPCQMNLWMNKKTTISIFRSGKYCDGKYLKVLIHRPLKHCEKRRWQLGWHQIWGMKSQMVGYKFLMEIKRCTPSERIWNILWGAVKPTRVWTSLLLCLFQSLLGQMVVCKMPFCYLFIKHILERYFR